MPDCDKGYTLCSRRDDIMLPRFVLLCVGTVAMFAGSSAAETPTDHYSPEISPPIDGLTQSELMPMRSDATDRMVDRKSVV